MFFMEAREPIPGLSRTENDAVTVVGAFAVGTAVLLCSTAVLLHLLSGLPPIMLGGLVFAVMVFAAVCLVAFLRSDLSSRHAGPPQLQFRKPVRRRRRPPQGGPRPLR